MRSLFDASIYAARRTALAAALPGGLVVLPGSDLAPMNYAHNAYPFVQDASFRYFFGADRPGVVGVLDVDAGEPILFGDEATLDDVIWIGETRTLAADAAAAGVGRVRPSADLAEFLQTAARHGRAIHFLPQYRADTLLKLAEALGSELAAVRNGASAELIAAIVAIREIKGPEEIAEMEAVLSLTREMHHAAMRETRPGRYEREIVGVIEGMARAADTQLAYGTIFTGRGEILHNLRHDRLIQDGDLIVNDSGAVSLGGYASDITRTLPASGRFTPTQRRLYEIVLAAQTAAIEAARPGVTFADLHRLASRTLVEGLSEIGVFRGDPGEIVESGAYAICFQCGLGHMIGLDVHDMEALGEDKVGYDGEVVRSPLFGFRNLRLGKRLKTGMAVTVEPGLYFIPQLIDLWRAERRFDDKIDYARLDAFRTFGGIRIEDDVLIEADGARVLGEPIAKSVEDVEALMGAAFRT